MASKPWKRLSTDEKLDWLKERVLEALGGAAHATKGTLRADMQLKRLAGVVSDLRDAVEDLHSSADEAHDQIGRLQKRRY